MTGAMLFSMKSLGRFSKK